MCPNAIDLGEAFSSGLLQEGRERVLVQPRRGLGKVSHRRKLGRHRGRSEIAQQPGLLESRLAMTVDFDGEEALVHDMSQSIDDSCAIEVDTRRRLVLQRVEGRTLAELGLTADQQEYVAEHSLDAARLIKNNPRPLDLAAMRAITQAAFTGDRQRLTAI